jgi:reversibly glycosylated polypeptide/UDP-arabinopyranose mutase
VVLNHGLWIGVPDFDAVTQLFQARYPQEFEPENQTIPVGMFFPMCGMNIAFKPEIVPALYFLLMGQGYNYDRFGDIWAGVIIKKICDHLGYAINSGEPFVRHQRASNVWTNLRKEVLALEANEIFWEAIDRMVLTGTTVAECYKEIANKLELEGEYWDKLRRAMRTWLELFE